MDLQHQRDSADRDYLESDFFHFRFLLLFLVFFFFFFSFLLYVCKSTHITYSSFHILYFKTDNACRDSPFIQGYYSLDQRSNSPCNSPHVVMTGVLSASKQELYGCRHYARSNPRLHGSLLPRWRLAPSD